MENKSYHEYDDYFSGYDSAYKPFFRASWADYEESAFIFIFEKDKKYYYIQGGHWVGERSYDPTWKDLVGPVSEDEVFELMIEWEEHEDS